MSNKFIVDLKPCPMCGQEAELEETESQGVFKTYTVYCQNFLCQVSGPTMLDINSAIIAWNTRVEKAEFCMWEKDTEDYYGCWNSGCGVFWTMMEDGPFENQMTYCPTCGKPIAVLKAYNSEENKNA